MLPDPLRWEPSQVERAIVVYVWHDLQELLCAGAGAVQPAIRALQQQLPQIDDLNARELPGLAKLHLGSSANLMKTFRLLAPSVFNDNSTLPDASLFLQLEGSDLEVVTVLIELQLFHLQRASALIAHAKQRLRYARPRM